MKNDVENTIGALTGTVNMLAGVPGRKALVYVGNGFPADPGIEAFVAVDRKFNYPSALLEVASFRMGQGLQDLAAHANAARVTIYTVDASGLEISSLTDVEGPAFSARLRGPGLEAIMRASRQEPLLDLPSSTGGRAISASNQVLPELTVAAQDFATYYSIGYTPEHAGDGRDHAVSVRVNRPHVTVRHRTGYLDKSPRAEMVDRTLAALEHGFSIDPIGLELVMDTPGTERHGRRFQVPFSVEVPLQALTPVPMGDALAAEVTLFFAAKNADGKRSALQETTAEVHFPTGGESVAAGGICRLASTLELRAGSQRIAVGLRETLTGQTAVISGTFFIGPNPT